MKKLITIGREFGSGGREFGRRLAEELGIEYYDKEIITEIAKNTDMSEEYIQSVLEGRPHQLFPITIGQSFSYLDSYYVGQVQSVYAAQSEIIQKLSEKSDCVIVGRCADYILRDLHPYRIFIYADMESRINRCIERSSAKEQVNRKEIKKHIQKIDKGRAKYYEYYTGKVWKDKENYDLCINTTNTSIKEIVPLIAKLFKPEHE